MNACARAAGADKTTAIAATAATNFEFILIILPRHRREIGRRKARGQPIPSASRVAENSHSGRRERLLHVGGCEVPAPKPGPGRMSDHPTRLTGTSCPGIWR